MAGARPISGNPSRELENLVKRLDALYGHDDISADIVETEIFKNSDADNPNIDQSSLDLGV